jgi:hypothetical protein
MFLRNKNIKKIVALLFWKNRQAVLRELFGILQRSTLKVMPVIDEFRRPGEAGLYNNGSFVPSGIEVTTLFTMATGTRWLNETRPELTKLIANA